jgi:hypothetical protein
MRSVNQVCPCWTDVTPAQKHKATCKVMTCGCTRSLVINKQVTVQWHTPHYHDFALSLRLWRGRHNCKDKHVHKHVQLLDLKDHFLYLKKQTYELSSCKRYNFHCLGSCGHAPRLPRLTKAATAAANTLHDNKLSSNMLSCKLSSMTTQKLFRFRNIILYAEVCIIRNHMEMYAIDEIVGSL